MKNTTLKAASQIAGICSLFFLTACNRGDPLPGGYAIFIASSSEIMLVDSKNAGVAGPHLRKVGNQGAHIFGEVQAMKGSTAGYFILDARSGTIQEGLNKTDWLEALKALGIPDEPALGDPEYKRPRR